MSEKVESTMVLDGMLEGRLPSDADVADRLRKWAAYAREQGLPVTVEIDGGRFSVLADPTPIETTPFGSDPSDFIAGLLNELLKHFPAGARAQLFSTLRSSTYHPGEEIQTIYLLGPEGRVRCEQRSVKADTVAPTPKMSRPTRVKLGFAGAAAAVILLGGLALIPGVRQMIAQTLSTVRPLDPVQVHVETGAFNSLFSVQVVETTRRGDGLVLEIRRTGDAPRSLAAIERATREADLSRRLALEAFARGYVRVEQFNADGQYFRTSTHRIRDLLHQEAILIDVPLSRRHRLHRLVVVY